MCFQMQLPEGKQLHASCRLEEIWEATALSTEGSALQVQCSRPSAPAAASAEKTPEAEPGNPTLGSLGGPRPAAKAPGADVALPGAASTGLERRWTEPRRLPWHLQGVTAGAVTVWVWSVAHTLGPFLLKLQGDSCQTLLSTRAWTPSLVKGHAQRGQDPREFRLDSLHSTC